MAEKKLTENAGETTINEIFSTKHFLQIPFFQRHYRWDAIKVKKFQEDVLGLVDRPDDVHFLGAIITSQRPKPHSTHPNLVEVIDGQQRLTTVFLHLCAVVHALLEADMVGEASELFQSCIVQYPYSGELSNIRLHSAGADRKAINEMVDGVLRHKNFQDHLPNFRLKKLPELTGAESSRSKIEANFRQAKTWLREQYGDDKDATRVIAIREALLESLTVVDILVNSPAEGPKIFNSLNSNQEPMSTGDLVRNDVFSRLADRDVSELHRLDEVHWQPFYKKFQIGDKPNQLFDGYFFPYGLIGDPSATTATVYQHLLRKWKDKSPKEIMEQLRAYQDAYLALAASGKLPWASHDLQVAVRKLVDARTPSSTYPFAMKLLSETARGSVEEATAVSILNLVQAFLVRRGLAGKEPTGLHAVFKRLWADLGDEISPAAVAKAIAQHKTVDRPTDKVLEGEISTRNAYSMKITPFVLREYDISLDGDDVGMPADVEHVLPQTPAGEWENFSKDQRETLTHTLANLIPLTEKMNGDVSNDSYESKRLRFKNSAFKTPRKIADEYQEWTPEIIMKRAEVLTKWALRRWPDPFAIL